MNRTATVGLPARIQGHSLGFVLAMMAVVGPGCGSPSDTSLPPEPKELAPSPEITKADSESGEGRTRDIEAVDGQLPWLQRSWRSEDQAHGHDLAVVDINGDGFQDVFVGIWGGADVLYFGGREGLTRAWQSEETLQSHGVAVGDADGDGKQDLVVGVKRGPSVVYLGEGGFSQAIWLAASSETKSVAVGDVDGDGDGDLVLGNQGPNELYLYEGGAFELAWTSAESEESDSVRLADFDRDGDLDLAVGNSTVGGQPNRVYRNEGGSFELDWVSPDGLASNQVAWGDLDGQGSLELAVSNAGAPAQVWSRGKTGWKEVWRSRGDRDGVGVAWGDIDGDGDVDLLAANPSGTEVFENRGGSLHFWGSFGQDGGTEALDVLDSNGDGRLGVALARNGAPLEVWEPVR